MPHGTEGIHDRTAMSRFRHVSQERDDKDEADSHENGRAVERPTPADATERAAQERADGDTESQGGLVEDNGAAHAATGRADDHGQSRGDKEGVAQSPPGAEADQHADAI